MLQSAPVPGAVTGQLRTLDGVPAVNVRVVAFAVPKGRENPDDNLNYFEMAAAVDRTLTDNEGNFRLQELLPGRYYLMAGAAGPGQATYYPGGPNIRDAEVLTVEAGIEVNNLNFQLVNRLGGKVSGRVNASMASDWTENRNDSGR